MSAKVMTEKHAPGAGAPKVPVLKVTGKKVPAAKRSTAPWGRLLVGFIGGYLASSLFVNAAIAILPGARHDLVMWGMMAVILVYVVLAMWCFAVRSWVIALRDMALVSALSAAVTLLSGWVSP